MAQYLMSLFGQRGGLDPFSGLDSLGDLFSTGMGENAAERGRWGDYVFNQEGRSIYLESQRMSDSVHSPGSDHDTINGKFKFK